MKKILSFAALLIFMGGGLFLFPESALTIYFQGRQFLNVSWDADKELIHPYFDEAFYRKEYAAEIRETGEAPIDHFLRRSGRLGGGDFDPNPWFNMRLYKERLWPCSGNAFVDFLKQPGMALPGKAKTVEVYANPHQLYRAWMAAEAFLRRNTYRVVLVLPETLKDTIPVQFSPMVKRGLDIRFSNDPTLSFYKSPFLGDPDGYGVTTMPAREPGVSDAAIVRYRLRPGWEYLVHNFQNATQWYKKGRLNPCMLNFAQYFCEPVEFSHFGQSEYDFKKSMQRLSPGFDLMLINSDIQTPNLRIVPGYMYTHVNNQEPNPHKRYEVSFLLSLGGKGMGSFKKRGTFIYHFRKEMWDFESRLSLPALFYISRRDKDKFPKSMHNRLLPTDSKKWIYESQFSIVIENSLQPNYFSEKLIDPLLCLTVPIYIGCPNITDYFDPRGMLIAKDPLDVLRLVKTLTPETYQRMLPYLIENKKRAERYMKLEKDYIRNFFEEEVGPGNLPSVPDPEGTKQP